MYLFQHELFEIGNLAVHSEVWHSSASLEGRSVDDDPLFEAFLEMSFDHIIVLLLNFVVYQHIN